MTELRRDLEGAPRGQGGAENQRQTGNGRRPLAYVLEILVILAAALVIAILVQAFLLKPFTVHQVSMRPTLENGDRILISRLTYRFSDPKRGDIVVLSSPLVDGEDLVKRVVAVADDTVSIHQGGLYVNNVRQTEPYLLDQYIDRDYAQIKIGPGQVFVLGDNRNNSTDSRDFGPVGLDTIVGKVFLVYWPVGHWKGL